MFLPFALVCPVLVDCTVPRRLDLQTFPNEPPRHLTEGEKEPESVTPTLPAPVKEWGSLVMLGDAVCLTQNGIGLTSEASRGRRKP